MSHAAVQNKDGQFVQPDDDSFQAAAAFADWKNAPGFYQILTDQPGKTSWPITGASFILMQTKQDKPQNAAEVVKFFDWAFKNGQKMASDLDYVPMPDGVVKLIAEAWKGQAQGHFRQVDTVSSGPPALHSCGISIFLPPPEESPLAASRSSRPLFC